MTGKKSHEAKAKKTITPRTNSFVNYRDSVFLISINQVFNSKFTVMKILSNKAYRELIAEKELTELSLKSLKSKYEFIVEANKRLCLKNDLLHIEIKSLSEKAEKYDIYLQKSKARKAKARSKAKELRKEFIDFVEKNLGNCYSVPNFGTCFLCGYSNDLHFVVLGSDINEGWSDTSDCVILREYKYYQYSYLGDIEPTKY